jgi:signal transduction histidine kinase
MTSPNPSPSKNYSSELAELIWSFRLELHSKISPLLAISGILLNEDTGPLNEKQKALVEILHNNSQRAAEVIDDFAHFVRIKGGTLRLSAEPIDITACVTRVVTNFRSHIEARDQILHNHIVNQPLVQADGWAVEQVLFNLIDNAHRYTYPKGEITLTAEVLDKFVKITVTDTGIGISPQDQETIFEEFFRTPDPLVREYSRTGLGLFFAKSYVEHMKGEIGCESELGKGSSFWFTLPIAE